MNSDSSTATLATDNDERITELRAKAALRPAVLAGLTVQQYSKAFGELSLAAVVAEIDTQIEAIQNGSMKAAEGMLLAQAHALDVLFHMMAQRALIAPGIDQQDKTLRLAFKAQSQCRTTLETLATVKNPHPVAFIRQANVAQNQQINNGLTPAGSQPRARKNQKWQNKLLECNDGERLDTRTSTAAVGVDTAVAALGKINRTEDGGGQGDGRKERG